MKKTVEMIIRSLEQEIEMREFYIGQFAVGRDEEILEIEIEEIKERISKVKKNAVKCPRCEKMEFEENIVDGMCEDCKMDYAIYYVNDDFEPIAVRGYEYDPEYPNIEARFEEAMVAQQCTTGLYDDLEFYDRYLNELLEDEADKYWRNLEY